MGVEHNDIAGKMRRSSVGFGLTYYLAGLLNTLSVFCNSDVSSNNQ